MINKLFLPYWYYFYRTCFDTNRKYYDKLIMPNTFKVLNIKKNVKHAL